ncbi:MAG: GNAT family N-acetyltransferase [Crenarchaeota archaeon]|nr:GNAT family N-acetyltransferase [Thermoproteota archaeon]MCR8455778.1 GNAT family N-acetyltransferase [Thermoproteota archaeon]MCR8501488.1 GNAT family N-acetyltransferase [Thermoproteota archaeon]
MKDPADEGGCSIRIRRFKPEDINQIKNVARAAFDSEVDKYWSVVGALRTPYTYIAEVCGKIIGVIEFELVYLSRSSEGHIGYIFVHPEYQGKGVGTALLKKAEEILYRRGARRIWAVTSPNNPKTRRFFEKNGYREVSTEIMKKTLGSNNTKKLLRRMVYFKGDIIHVKELSSN